MGRGLGDIPSEIIQGLGPPEDEAAWWGARVPGERRKAKARRAEAARVGEALGRQFAKAALEERRRKQAEPDRWAEEERRKVPFVYVLEGV